MNLSFLYRAGGEHIKPGVQGAMKPLGGGTEAESPAFSKWRPLPYPQRENRGFLPGSLAFVLTLN